MSIRRGGNIVAGSVNKREIVDLIENETRVNIKTITGTLTTASSTISLDADDLVNGSQILSVNLGNTVILPNLYSLSNDGKTLTFVETIDANTNYAISYVKKFDIGHALDYNDRATVVGWGMPDYDSGVSMTSPYTTPCDGYLFIQTFNGTQRWEATINSQKHYYTAVGSSTISCATWNIINKGVIVTKTDSGNNDVAIFYPLKGTQNA